MSKICPIMTKNESRSLFQRFLFVIFGIKVEQPSLNCEEIKCMAWTVTCEVTGDGYCKLIEGV